MRNWKLRLLQSVIITLLAIGVLVPSAYSQGYQYRDIALSGQARPIAGANVAVCQTLATSAASVSANLATFTVADTTGFVSGNMLTVVGFTGGDTYFNGAYNILVVPSPTQIVVALTHANASASSNGTVLQEGSVTQACAPLVTVYTDYTLGTSCTGPPGCSNPTQTDGLGNYTFAVGPAQLWLQIYGPGVTTTFQSITVPCVTDSSCGGGGGGIVPSTVAGANYVATSTGVNTAAWELVNSGSSCGDSTHAISFNSSTHVFGCQSIVGTGVPGGSNTDCQFNNLGAFGGTSDCTYTSSTHTIAGSSSSIWDFHTASAVNLPCVTGTTPNSDTAYPLIYTGTNGLVSCDTTYTSGHGSLSTDCPLDSMYGGCGVYGWSGSGEFWYQLNTLASTFGCAPNPTVIGGVIDLSGAGLTIDGPSCSGAGSGIILSDDSGGDISISGIRADTTGGIIGWGTGGDLTPVVGQIDTNSGIVYAGTKTGLSRCFSGNSGSDCGFTGSFALTDSNFSSEIYIDNIGTSIGDYHYHLPDTHGSMGQAQLSGGGSASMTWSGLLFSGNSLLPPIVNSSVLGSATVPFLNAYFGPAANESFSWNVSGLTGNRVYITPDSSGTLGIVTGSVANNDCLAGSVSAGVLTIKSASVGTCSGSSGTSVALSAITAAAGSNSIANGDNAQEWQWIKTTNSTSAMTFDDNGTASSCTTCNIIDIFTKSTSTAFPIAITAQGTANGVRMSTAGLLGPIGSGGINATLYKGGTASGVGSACSSHNWVTTLNDAAGPTCAQPAFTDISGNINVSQMNSGTNADSSHYWRGDGTWVIPPGGISIVGTPAANSFAQWVTSSSIQGLASAGGGTNGLLGTPGSGTAGDFYGYNNVNVLTETTPGIIPNIQASTYAVSCTPGTGDRGTQLIFNSASAQAVSIPQAGTGSCGNNFYFNYKVLGAGTVTFTPATSTVNPKTGAGTGTATFVAYSGQAGSFTSNNTDYFATASAPYIAQDCGTTTTCADTIITGTLKIVKGSASLVSGTPSTAAVTGISPAFTSSSSYVCTVSAESAATGALLSVANVSSSAFTITGPATVTTVVNYICVGN